MLRFALAVLLTSLSCADGESQPVIDVVSPGQIAPGVATAIEIRGRHFYSRASVDLSDKQPVQEDSGFTVRIGELKLTRRDVRQTSSEEVVVLLPPMAEGTYDVELILPDSRSDLLRQGLVVGTPITPAQDAGPDGAPGLADANTSCPTGYLANVNGSCYRFVTAAATWMLAEADCEDDASGAHLIVVDDATENAMLPPFHWIGYSEIVTAGVFLWVNGSTAAYAGFAASDPVIGGAQCVVTRPDGWHDVNCGGLKSYVCEFDGIPADPTTY